MKNQAAQTVSAYIGLGGNIGNVLNTFLQAIVELNHIESIQPVAFSNLYQTTPVGVPDDQPDYLNAVIKVHAACRARQLLDHLLAIEQRMGRQRAQRWASRTIDLDILLFNDEVHYLPDLQIPHPRMTDRLFVLAPLADIAASCVHPVLNQPITVLLNRLAHQTTSKIKLMSDPRWPPTPDPLTV